jgi:transcriptional regulator with PAS, ATPase and Fis domain
MNTQIATLEDHLAPAEWEHINSALDQFEDDKAATAVALGVSVATLYRRIGILQAKFGKRQQVQHRGREAKGEDVAQLEKEAAKQAVADAGGDKKAAAAILGISLPTLYRRLKNN